MNPDVRFLRCAAFVFALLSTPLAARAQTAPASGPLPPASAPAPKAAVTAARDPVAPSLLGQVSQQASDLVVNALDQIGVRYRWGGDGNGSFDCSGLVQHVYQQTLGLLLPHNARAQSREGVPVAADALQPGDLVFFKTLRRTISHVGIYIGDGKFVHAPRTGAVVEIGNLNSGYWAKRFVTARRLLDASVDPVATAAASQPRAGMPTPSPALLAAAASAARAAASAPAAHAGPVHSSAGKRSAHARARTHKRPTHKHLAARHRKPLRRASNPAHRASHPAHRVTHPRHPAKHRASAPLASKAIRPPG